MTDELTARHRSLYAERYRPAPPETTVEQLLEQLIDVVATHVCARRGITLDRHTARRVPVRRRGITVWEDRP